jgi:alkanesulfonate monooxygenase SsuD/methylene tetrahydromethanopterin reductase-like flavin-dependent oxidoreductase (luciferase family)
VEIGLGVDARFALSEDDQIAVAASAKRLGYLSLWTPIAAERGPFDTCVSWHRASGLATGIAVAPLSAWPPEKLASVANETFAHAGRRFTLGVGSGRIAKGAIEAMREAAAALGERCPGIPVYLGALGPRMLHLAGERYDGVALNWCTVEQIVWSRERVGEGARAVGRSAGDVRIHEYVRVCVDEDESAARLAFTKMVMTYALAAPGADKTKGYRAHFARMGFGTVLEDLERRRDAGAREGDLAARFPDELLRRVGYWGPAGRARDAFDRLARGLDIAIVRLVPATRNDLPAVLAGLEACAPLG